MNKLPENILNEIEKIRVCNEELVNAHKTLEAYFGNNVATQNEFREDIVHSVNAIEELAYRRGYNHGFNFGLTADESKVSRIKENIMRWKDDLDDDSGAPGSPYENVKMSLV